MKRPTYEQINAMAGEIWLRAGGQETTKERQDHNWFLAEQTLITLMNQAGDQ